MKVVLKCPVLLFLVVVFKWSPINPCCKNLLPWSNRVPPPPTPPTHPTPHLCYLPALRVSAFHLRRFLQMTSHPLNFGMFPVNFAHGSNWADVGVSVGIPKWGWNLGFVLCLFSHALHIQITSELQNQNSWFIRGLKAHIYSDISHNIFILSFKDWNCTNIESSHYCNTCFHLLPTATFPAWIWNVPSTQMCVSSECQTMLNRLDEGLEFQSERSIFMQSTTIFGMGGCAKNPIEPFVIMETQKPQWYVFHC